MRLSPTLSFYIARQFTLWLVAFFAGFSLIIIVADTLELLRRSALHPEINFINVVELASLKLPHTAQDLLPFAVLFGGIMAFWRLTHSNELVVARAVGVSVWQFMAPAIFVAIAVGLFKMLVLHSIAAATFSRYELLEAKMLKGQINQSAIGPSGLWLRQSTSDGHAIIHSLHVSSDLKTLTDVMVLRYGEEQNFLGRIDAPEAHLLSGAWELEDASEAPNGRPPQHIGTVRLPTDFTTEKIQESFARPDTMSFWSLPSFIQQLEKAGFSAVRHRLFFQSLLAAPLLLSAMVIIAATFSLRPARRGGVGRMIASGVVAGFLLYFMSDIVYALGSATRIPVLLAAWSPAVVSTLLGLAMLLHLEDG
jgi:lipopolysaccharide export system permease protein